jgi:hypothetical protein
MYKIIGADGKEYGPIPLETVRQWILERRANGHTRVQAEGTPDWRPLSDFPELAALLVQPAALPGLGTPPLSPITPITSVPSNDIVNGPAIGLIVVGVLDLLFAVARFGLFAAGINPLSGMSTANPQWVTGLIGLAGVAGSLLGLLCGSLILFGGIKMRSLQSYGLCMTASILAMVPCTSGCCLIGLPVGIWALVVLSKPEVKNSFR